MISFHHDNVPAHSVLSIQESLVKQSTVIPHLPYPLDLAPCDCFLFPKLKAPLKGHRFAMTEEINQEHNMGTISDSIASPLGMLSEVAEVLESVYTV